MKKLQRSDLLTLEAYAAGRDAFRDRVLAHKRDRAVALGANISLLFEDRLTVQYQVQEMLRIERIFEAVGIDDELAAYNPLVPDGGDLKATMLIEYPDPEVRAQQLIKLRGIERRIGVRIGAHKPVVAHADEDMERENEQKTSAVHFLRFELTPAMIADLRNGASLGFAVDHPDYSVETTVAETVRKALLADLD